jgi:cell division septal protein FtsQ
MRMRVRSTRMRTARYQVAVPTLERAEERVIVLPRIVDVLLLVVVGWLLYWFTSADLFYINGLKVEGSWRLAEVELLSKSGLQGTNVFWADTQAAEIAIRALPDVESVDVRCRLPAECVVRVSERPPSVVWRQGDAEVWVGSDGVVLPPRGALPFAIVVEAVDSTALKPGDEIDPGLVSALTELERLQPDVRVYRYSDTDGLSFWNTHGWEVRIGDGHRIQSKLELADALTRHFLERGITPTFVDVRFPEAPFYKE